MKFPPKASDNIPALRAPGKVRKSDRVLEARLMFLQQTRTMRIGEPIEVFFSDSPQSKANGSVKVCSPTIQPRCTKSVR
jgi:hypothetical protein